MSQSQPSPPWGTARDDGTIEERDTRSRILLVEDNPGDEILIREWLTRTGIPLRIIHRTRLADAIAVFANEPIDLVLLDLALPDAHGLEGVQAIRGVQPHVPLIVLTGHRDESLARACVSVGAHDYLEKDDVNPASLRRSIALATARSSEAQARARLFHQDRLQTIGRLAASAAHEINNPLQFVTANISVVMQQIHAHRAGVGADPDEFADALSALDDALKGAQRIRRIVGALGQFARVDEQEKRSVDMRAVVADACDMVGNYVRQHANLVVHLDELPTHGEEGRLCQVVVNLLVNGVQAIEQAERDDGRITVRGRVHDGSIEVRVKDNGCGMSPATLRHVFDPFVTSKAQGLGLGLALSHDIIAEHGGTLTASSEAGRGSTFLIRLPFVRSKPLLKAVPPLIPTPVGEPLRILIVDDEPLVLRSLGRSLRGHDITLCERAVDALAKIKSATEPFDAVICDLSMPEMGGRALYAEAKAVDPSLAQRFIVMTGGALTAQDGAFADQVGALRKPISPHDLKSRLATLPPRA